MKPPDGITVTNTGRAPQPGIYEVEVNVDVSRFVEACRLTAARIRFFAWLAANDPGEVPR